VIKRMRGLRVSAVISLLIVISSTLLLSSKPALGQADPGKGLKPKSPSLARKDYVFADKALKDVVEELGEAAKLSVVWDRAAMEGMGNCMVSTTLRDLTAPRALEIVLGVYGLPFFPVDSRTIAVTKDKRPRDGGITIQSLILKAEIEEAEQKGRSNNDSRENLKFEVRYDGESLYSAVLMLAQRAGLKILFEPMVEDSAKQTSVRISLSDVTIAGALTFILDAYDLKYAQIGDNAIRIVAPGEQNSPVPLGDIIKSRN
jgi:hypothetical protein